MSHQANCWPLQVVDTTIDACRCTKVSSWIDECASPGPLPPTSSNTASFHASRYAITLWNNLQSQSAIEHFFSCVPNERAVARSRGLTRLSTPTNWPPDRQYGARQLGRRVSAACCCRALPSRPLLCPNDRQYDRRLSLQNCSITTCAPLPFQRSLQLCSPAQSQCKLSMQALL